MLRQLPYNILTILRWYIISFPKLLLKIAKRILTLLTYEISFGVNLRLVFTPLFGDYTIVGRIIGFIVRFFEIIFGFIFLVLVFFVLYLLPIAWLALPAVLIYYVPGMFFVYTIFVATIHLYSSRNIPKSRVDKATEANILTSFRPHVLYYHDLMVSRNKVIPKFFQEPQIVSLLRKSELPLESFSQKLLSGSVKLTGVAKRSFDIAKDQGTRYVELEHLFLGIISSIPKHNVMLASFGTTFDHCSEAARWIALERERLASVFVWQEDYELPLMGGIGKGLTGRVTPVLDAVSEDLTKKARSGTTRDIVGREKEMKEIAQLLSGSKINVMLLGPAGSGKTSIVRGIAHKVISGTEFKSLQFKRIVSIDTAALISGAKTSGQLAKKIKDVMADIKDSGDIILFFDEIHNLISGSTSGDNVSSVFSLLEPYLTAGNIQFIGATSVQNYRKYIEPAESFARLFDIVDIKEASDRDTLKILEVVAPWLEKKYGIVISYKSLVEAIKLSKKLIHERVLPDKAIDILDRTCVEVVNTTRYVTSKDIKEEIAEVTHIPSDIVNEENTEKLIHVETELLQRVIGQDHAITQIGKAIRRASVGIRDEKKPIASFLFVGTTGVGKTETAKALAATHFNSEESMIRLDMSEYQQQDSMSRLLGDPNGDHSGILTEAIRSRPFALVLLDEIEKAYSSILLTFLQVLDDGRLTDSVGTTVDFTNTIIIATSNVGTKEIQEASAAGADIEKIQEVAMHAVRNKFAPEFLNRFDGIIVFKPLELDSVRKIVGLMLTRVTKVAESKSIKVSFKPELIDELIKRGYNKEWGARPLARVIEDTVESYLALKILQNEINMGDEVDLGMEVFA